MITLLLAEKLSLNYEMVDFEMVSIKALQE